jgi:hypothetical protein
LVVAAGLVARADCVAVDLASLEMRVARVGRWQGRQIRRNTRSILVVRLVDEGLGDPS